MRINICNYRKGGLPNLALVCSAGQKRKGVLVPNLARVSGPAKRGGLPVPR